jgi:hypothetical protein
MEKNPFLIDIPDKDEYDIHDYSLIQEKLNNIDISSYIEKMYTSKNDFYGKNEFYNRCSRGIRQKLCDIENNLLPTKNLYKIGNGGDHKSCFVCCTAFSHDRIEDDQYQTRYIASQQIKKSLEEVGYNGHLLLMNGGFPTPRGIEMKYVGVPYCFKIFLMLEAEKLGFERVIWIDSGCYAVNNPEHLFDVLKEKHTLFRSFPNNINHIVFQETADLLDSLTGGDIHNSVFVNSIVFGLNLTNEKIKKFIDQYYAMVVLGLPFLSIYPEEIVFTALFNQPEFKEFIHSAHENYMLQIHEIYGDLQRSKEIGYYFVHKNYNHYIGGTNGSPLHPPL